MKLILPSLALLSSLVFIAFASEAPVVTTPVLSWSNYKYFSGRDQISDIFNTEHLVNSKLVSAQGPEVVVLFIEPELRTDELSSIAGAYGKQPNGGVFGNLKRLIETSSSSLVAPYVHGIYPSSLVGTSIASDLLINLSLKSSKPVSVFVASSNPDVTPSSFSNPRSFTPVSNIKTEKMTIEQMKQKMQSNWDILHNGVTDVLVVYLDSVRINESQDTFASDDELMSFVSSALKNTNYVAVFTAESSDAYLVANFGDYVSLLKRDNTTDNSTSSDSDSDSNWPAEVVEALVLMIPFIIVILTGVCCTGSLQSDLKYDAEKPRRF